MEWISAKDELPTSGGKYVVVDLRFNRLKVLDFSPNGTKNSLFYKIPENILWMKVTIEEHNQRIFMECTQSAKNTGGVYIFTMNTKTI